MALLGGAVDGDSLRPARPRVVLEEEDESTIISRRFHMAPGLVVILSTTDAQTEEALLLDEC